MRKFTEYLYRHEPREGWEIWLCHSLTNDRLELIDTVRTERQAAAKCRKLNAATEN